jgi:hypothetical protein
MITYILIHWLGVDPLSITILNLVCFVVFIGSCSAAVGAIILNKKMLLALMILMMIECTLTFFTIDQAVRNKVDNAYHMLSKKYDKPTIVISVSQRAFPSINNITIDGVYIRYVVMDSTIFILKQYSY